MTGPRQQIEISIGDQKFTLLPCHEAIYAIEAEYDGLLAASRRVQIDGSVRAATLVIWAGASKAGQESEPTQTEVAEAMVGHVADGLAGAMRYLTVCINGAMILSPEKEETADSAEGKS